MQQYIDAGVAEKIAPGTAIDEGTVVRRINSEKDQQGAFMRYDDEGGLVLVNVVDMKNTSFAAEAGILRCDPMDELYRYNTGFANSPRSADALTVLTEWALYKKHPQLQDAMKYFFMTAFVPEQILAMKKSDSLKQVFIPLQQKFKIGKFVEVVDWDNVRFERFMEQLYKLDAGDHLTYVAMVPQTSTYKPLFYSIGTKPHQSTAEALKSEPFGFKPTHGGHIKCVESEEGVILLVDAGSDFLGKGLKTPLRDAELVVKALKQVYPNFFYKPLEGRGAFGSEQSY